MSPVALPRSTLPLRVVAPETSKLLLTSRGPSTFTSPVPFGSRVITPLLFCDDIVLPSILISVSYTHLRAHET